MDQHFELSNDIVTPDIQDVISDAYTRVNQKIFEIMVRNNEVMPDIKRYVQLQKKYRGREQRKIKINRYKPDMIHPKEEVALEMLKMCVKTL